MKKENAMKWVEALRSGKYKQGAGVLLNEKNEYCCLGVLAEINGFEKSELMARTTLEKISLKCSDEFDIKSPVGDIFGLKIRSKTIGCGYTTLASANDAGVTFGELADFIESNYDLF